MRCPVNYSDYWLIDLSVLCNMALNSTISELTGLPEGEGITYWAQALQIAQNEGTK